MFVIKGIVKECKKMEFKKAIENDNLGIRESELCSYNVDTREFKFKGEINFSLVLLYMEQFVECLVVGDNGVCDLIEKGVV